MPGFSLAPGLLRNSARRETGRARPRPRAPRARARPGAARRPVARRCGAPPPAPAASRRATGCAAAAARAGTCRSRCRPGSPRSRDSPSLPKPGHDAAERLGARVQQRPAGVVLEAGHRAPLARIELALEQHVADHPPLPGDGDEREDARARQLLAGHGRGSRGRAAGSRRRPRAPPRRSATSSAQRLARAQRDPARSAPARDPGRRRRRPGRTRPAAASRRRSGVISSSKPAPGGAPVEHRDVPAVGVDVEVVGVEVGDPDLTRPAPSTGARGRARSTISRSASIAV